MCADEAQTDSTLPGFKGRQFRERLTLLSEVGDRGAVCDSSDPLRL